METDAARSGGNVTKDSQIRNLKSQFKSQLEQYQQEESTYKKRYQDQIARQYRIVNPDATEEEVHEAAQANWGDEGVFQTAVSLRNAYQKSTKANYWNSSNPTDPAQLPPSSDPSAPATTISRRSNRL